MLYLPPGTALPERVHGAFVSDDEVHRIVKDWRQRGEPDYLEEVLTGGEADAVPGIAAEGGDGEGEGMRCLMRRWRLLLKHARLRFRPFNANCE